MPRCGFFDKDFFGSASVKKVLPVLAPELSYKDLEVDNGLLARRVWTETVLNGKDGHNRAEVMYNLRKYCELDTFGMMRILEELRKNNMSELEISKFLKDKKITQWPKKNKYRQLLREYLISKVEVGKKYSEKEINELLNLYHEFNDPAFLRRELYDYKLLERDKFGKQYWKTQLMTKKS